LWTFWDNSGDLAIAVNDWAFDKIYSSETPHFHHNMQGWANFRYSYDTSLLADEISADYFYSTAGGDFLKSVRVKDTLRGWNVRETRQLYWSRAKL
jgi:hypothetical protein